MHRADGSMTRRMRKRAEEGQARFRACLEVQLRAVVSDEIARSGAARRPSLGARLAWRPLASYDHSIEDIHACMLLRHERRILLIPLEPNQRVICRPHLSSTKESAIHLLDGTPCASEAAESHKDPDVVIRTRGRNGRDVNDDFFNDAEVKRVSGIRSSSRSLATHPFLLHSSAISSAKPLSTSCAPATTLRRQTTSLGSP